MQPKPRRHPSLWMTSLLCAGLGLAGCQAGLTERQVVPPTEAKSAACLDACTFAEQQCLKRQELREALCRDHEAQLSADLDDCQRDPSNICPEPAGCLGVDAALCTTQLETCILSCGGRVETRQRLPVKLPWIKGDAAAAPATGYKAAKPTAAGAN